MFPSFTKNKDFSRTYKTRLYFQGFPGFQGCVGTLLLIFSKLLYLFKIEIVLEDFKCVNSAQFWNFQI